MNYAKLENSPRLQRALDFLSDGKWHSSREIVHGAEVMNPNNVKCELVRNGFPVEHKQEGRIHYYRLVEKRRGMFAA